MNDSFNRKLETCRRVKDFCTARAADFLATSLATQLFAKLTTGIDTLGGLTAAQTSRSGAAREGTATRGDAREELRSRMKAWSATARTPSPSTIPVSNTNFACRAERTTKF